MSNHSGAQSFRHPALVARDIYHRALGGENRDATIQAMAHWEELSEAERSFALTHLAYLQLQSDAMEQRMHLKHTRLLEDILEVLEDMAEVVCDGPGIDDEEYDQSETGPGAEAPISIPQYKTEADSQMHDDSESMASSSPTVEGNPTKTEHDFLHGVEVLAPAGLLDLLLADAEVHASVEAAS